MLLAAIIEPFSLKMLVCSAMMELLYGMVEMRRTILCGCLLLLVLLFESDTDGHWSLDSALDMNLALSTTNLS